MRSATSTYPFGVDRGFRSIELMRRDAADEVEFVTRMRFDSIGDVVAFVGEDYETVYVPDAARKVLKRFDERSARGEGAAKGLSLTAGYGQARPKAGALVSAGRKLWSSELAW